MTESGTGGDRIVSEVPGLDRVLGGGLLMGRLAILHGAPGSGKTVLAAQIAFALARAGRRTVYVSMLGETHGDLVANLASFSFFDRAQIGTRIVLLNAYEVLEREGSAGLQTLLRQTMRQHEASFVIVDSLGAPRALASEPQEFRKFLRGLAAAAGLLGCTVLCIVSRRRALDEEDGTVGDALLVMHRRTRRGRTVRFLQVLKLRGSAHLEGEHTFVIDADGLHVHPRLEALPMGPAPAEGDEARLSFGVGGLDAMTGGVPKASSTLLIGGPGTGKTVLGLHFLHAGLEAGERGLYFGFNEHPSQLLASARGFGLPLEDALRDGRLLLRWQAPTEQPIDALAETLLALVREHRPTRLFVDGLDGFAGAAFRPGRLPRFFTALATQLRGLGTTTFATEETDLLNPIIERPIVGTSALVDNIVLVRSVEIDSRLRRLVSVMKMRGTDHDRSLREFTIGPAGFVVGPPFEGTERMLTGYGQATAPAAKRAAGSRTKRAAGSRTKRAAGSRKRGRKKT